MARLTCVARSLRSRAESIATLCSGVALHCPYNKMTGFDTKDFGQSGVKHYILIHQINVASNAFCAKWKTNRRPRRRAGQGF